MSNLNQIILEGVVKGKVTSIPYAPSVTVFNVSDGESSFEVETYGKLAEFAFSKFDDGSRVRVIGKLKEKQTTDNEGKNYPKIVVIAEHLEIMEIKK